MDAFSKVCKLAHETELLSSILRLTEWDIETYMPEGSSDSRSKQIELLSLLIHKRSTSNQFKKAIEAASKEVLDPPSLRAIELWQEELSRLSKIPNSWVRSLSSLTSHSLAGWKQANEQQNFKIFSPYLKKMVSLFQKKADLLGYQEHPYDALLDLYEPKMTVSFLNPLFSKLKTELSTLLSLIKNSPEEPKLPLFPKELQRKAGDLLLETLQIPKQFCRLDLSHHPFCTGINLTDVRITSRIFENNISSHLLSVLHEAGHALYHLNLPKEFEGTPLCASASYGIDESQSRFWETCIGKSFSFWLFFYPKLQDLFPELQTISLEQFYQSINQVKPSLIRVEADEVTYCLHIILRFEIEKALIEGSLKVEEIPEIWKEKMKDLLGIAPSHDGEGCLQDIHWAAGLFGYFPSYAIGNLFAAQLRSTLQSQFTNFETIISSGDFTPILSWMKTNIHLQGRLYSPEKLILRSTQSVLKTEPYLAYLHEKFCHSPYA